jgi:membrane protein
LTAAQGLLATLLQWLVLVMALKSLPNTDVSWRAAWWGGLASVALLTLAVRLFGLYTGAFAVDDPVHRFYGSLGALPVFLLWLYLAWLSVLLGVEVAAMVDGVDERPSLDFTDT